MIIIIFIVLLILDYKYFMYKREKEINSFPTVKTSFGEVSYIDINPDKNEVILFCTGGGVGFDSVLAFKWLTHTDYRVICINRHGYYKLPIAEDFKTHVEIYHEVLEALGIKEVFIFGVSMGGVSALMYALKYGAKKLLLWSAVTKSYVTNSEATNSTIGKLVMGSNMKDIISYFIMKSAQFMPITTITEFFCASVIMNKTEIKKQAKKLMQCKETKLEFMCFIKSMTPMSHIYNGMMKEVEMTQNLELDLTKLKTPCLAIHSVLDKDVSIEHLNYLEKNVPNIKAIRTECMGHYIWWGNKSSEVKEASMEFLSKKLEMDI
ncbi:hypothetical protein AN641_09545 [Candidatus Epulonipiscioides gigas]|nr:hypothetical protein AN641_09545 [Epulopiscium sp. SCG-C07WGA-EpuloA2]